MTPMECVAYSNCSGNISSIIGTKRIMKPFPPNIRAGEASCYESGFKSEKQKPSEVLLQKEFKAWPRLYR